MHRWPCILLYTPNAATVSTGRAEGCCFYLRTGLDNTE